MATLPESLIYEGVSIDVSFSESRPHFGDVFLICGSEHHMFHPTGTFSFDLLTHLQFDQVDDYFGVRSLAEEGDDVVVWLYPLVEGEPVHHHPGPFDGLRLDYNILRNPVRHIEHYIACVCAFAAYGDRVTYRTRGEDIGVPPDLAAIKADIQSVVAYWSSKGISVGSNGALEIDF